MTALALAPPPLPTPTAYREAADKFNQSCAQLQGAPTQTMTHSEVESRLESEGRELLRRLLQAHLDERGPGTTSTPVVDAQGHRHSHQRVQERTLARLFGPVTVTRMGYGGGGQTSLHPLDAALNLPRERSSHPVRQRVAQAAAVTSFDEVVTQLRQHTGTAVPKRQAEVLAQRAAQDFAAFYEHPPAERVVAAPAATDMMVLSTDGKGIPLRAADLRPATRAAAATRQHKLPQRCSRGEKRGSKRMGTVAAVYTSALRTPEQILRELRPPAQALPVERPRARQTGLGQSGADPAGGHPPGLRRSPAARSAAGTTLGRVGGWQWLSIENCAAGGARVSGATDDGARLHPRL